MLTMTPRRTRATPRPLRSAPIPSTAPEATALLAGLLSIERGDNGGSLALSPEARRRGTIEALLEHVDD